MYVSGKKRSETGVIYRLRIPKRKLCLFLSIGMTSNDFIFNLKELGHSKKDVNENEFNLLESFCKQDKILIFLFSPVKHS